MAAPPPMPNKEAAAGMATAMMTSRITARALDMETSEPADSGHRNTAVAGAAPWSQEAVEPQVHGRHLTGIPHSWSKCLEACPCPQRVHPVSQQELPASPGGKHGSGVQEQR